MKKLKHQPATFTLVILLLAAVVVSACSPASQKPGSRIVATPNANMQLVNAFVTHDPSQLDKGELVPSVIPTGIKKIYLGIRFKNLGTDVDRFKVDYKITYKGLEVPVEFDSEPTSWTEQSSGAKLLIMPIRRTDEAPFADGEYRAQILINQQVVAELQYKIGGGED